MATVGKKYKKVSEKVNPEKAYPVADASALLKEISFTKFDPTIEIAMNLGVDPRHADQNVRGAVVLPNGLGRKVRVLVFAKGPKEAEAKEAGADFVGGDDLVEKINGGWLEFDKAIATPDMMGTVSKVAKVLGPRGLMPNPKVGTVTMNVGDTVKAEKRGKLDFRVDKAGIIHAGIGKKSMGADKLKENFAALIGAVVKAKPARLRARN
jgi:large subunit ribosomal protein L1